MRILFLGQNPSKHNFGSEAFLGSKSGKTLLKWISMAKLPEDCYFFLNSFENLPSNGKRYSSLEIVRSAELLAKRGDYDAIVACGKVATRVARIVRDLTCKPYISIEHPSGLNRNLNDPFNHYVCVSKILNLFESLKSRGYNESRL